MAATTPCNATPPAHGRSAYIWFGKFKRWPPLPLETPSHLHNNAQHIFGLENLKDGRQPQLPLETPRHLHTEGEHIFCLENLKDGRHYDLQHQAT
jgi:hypothetical protein